MKSISKFCLLVYIGLIASFSCYATTLFNVSFSDPAAPGVPITTLNVPVNGGSKNIIATITNKMGKTATLRQVCPNLPSGAKKYFDISFSKTEPTDIAPFATNTIYIKITPLKITTSAQRLTLIARQTKGSGDNGQGTLDINVTSTSPTTYTPTRVVITKSDTTMQQIVCDQGENEESPSCEAAQDLSTQGAPFPANGTSLLFSAVTTIDGIQYSLFNTETGLIGSERYYFTRCPLNDLTGACDTAAITSVYAPNNPILLKTFAVSGNTAYIYEPSRGLNQITQCTILSADCLQEGLGLEGGLTAEIKYLVVNGNYLYVYVEDNQTNSPSLQRCPLSGDDAYNCLLYYTGAELTRSPSFAINNTGSEETAKLTAVVTSTNGGVDNNIALLQCPLTTATGSDTDPCITANLFDQSASSREIVRIRYDTANSRLYVLFNNGGAGNDGVAYYPLTAEGLIDTTQTPTFVRTEQALSDFDLIDNS